MSENQNHAFIVDDDEEVRSSLEWLLSSRKILSRAWSSGESFLKEFDPAVPGCVILDIRLKNMSGLEVFDAMLAKGIIHPVIFLSGHADIPMAVSALHKGAYDFLEKPFQDNHFVDRILQAFRDAEINKKNRERSEETFRKLASLSIRESQVLGEIAKGKLNKEIAFDLGITMRTVEAHRANLYRKLGVSNQTDLFRLVFAESTLSDKTQ